MADRLKLSPKQERFCLLIVKGETQSSAYEQAGYSVKSREIAIVNASRLLKTASVSQYIEKLREDERRRHHYDSDVATADLLALQKKATDIGSLAVAVECIKTLCKLHGLMVEKSEVTVSHKPAPLPTKVLELSEADWVRQFGVDGLKGSNLKIVKAK